MNRKIALAPILTALIVLPLIGQTSQQIKEPVLIQAVDPAYPNIALQARIEGIVVLEFTVGSDGRVSAVKVIKSTPLLDNAAIEAVKQWTYKPGQINGKPAAFTGTTIVNFRITSGDAAGERRSTESVPPPITFRIAAPQIESPPTESSASATPAADSHPDAAGQGVIPEKILKLLEGGLAKRKGRQDIFLFVVGNTVLPGKENELFGAFNVKLKTGDLNPPEVKPGTLQTFFGVYARFHPLVAGTAGAAIREIDFPGDVTMEKDQFDAKREDLYCFGYSLPPGGYVMALAVATLNQKKIGMTYYEFVLPDAVPAAGPEVTSVLFAKNIQPSSAPEPRPILRRNPLDYYGRYIDLNADYLVGAGEDLKIIYGVLGARQSSQNKLSLEVSYEVQKEGKSVIAYPKAVASTPVVETSLPLKIMGSGKAAAGAELASGSYTLMIRILDKLSKKTAEKKVDFYKL
jgi:TonB family protein